MNVVSKIDGLAEQVLPLPRQGKRSRAILAGSGLAALMGVGVLARVLLAPAPAPAPAPPVVLVAQPLKREVAEWDSFIGRFAPSQAVDIRPRVSGAVTAIHFRDGDIVEKDQLLFTIDQRPFVAALAEAKANVEAARSALVLARSDLTRASRLKGDEALSGGQMDSLRARVDAAEANLAAAQARQEARALDVEFTEVRSPIAGRVSDRRIDIGNLVTGGESGSATLLTTVAALDPIYFTFDRSESLYLKAQRLQDAGVAAPTAEIRLQDETDYRWKGTLDFVDNGLNPHSGTIRARVTLANPDYFLTPGMFGKMRLADGGKATVLLVPDAAVRTDQARKIVLTVDEHNVVGEVPVETGPLVDGLRIVRSGLSPSAHIVIGGIPMAVPGKEVRAQSATFQPQPQSTQAFSTPVSAEATLLSE